MFKRFGDYFTVHVLEVLRDNFCYVVVDGATNEAAVVDCSEVPPVLSKLKELNVTKFAVMTTHKHWDHSNGNKELAQLFPELPIFGGSRDNVPCCTRPLNDGDQFCIGNLQVTVFHTPCHTSGHVLYHVVHPQDPDNGAIFTGDTLFIGGIGAFFEGNAQQMLEACARVAKLPGGTAVYPGHEYTLNFLKFAKTVDPDNAFIGSQLAHYETLRKAKTPTCPSFVRDELRQNVFMRCADPALQALVRLQDPVKVMQHLYDTCP